jgi:hypothetical protein
VLTRPAKERLGLRAPEIVPGPAHSEIVAVCETTGEEGLGGHLEPAVAGVEEVVIVVARANELLFAYNNLFGETIRAANVHVDDMLNVVIHLVHHAVPVRGE